MNYNDYDDEYAVGSNLPLVVKRKCSHFLGDGPEEIYIEKPMIGGMTPKHMPVVACLTEEQYADFAARLEREGVVMNKKPFFDHFYCLTTHTIVRLTAIEEGGWVLDQ